jgi:hypothetical protein
MRAERLEAWLAALRTMSTAQLRQGWERVHRAPAPPNFVADLLARSIAYTLQERAYGGLTPATRRELTSKSKKGQGAERGASAPRLSPGSRLAREWGGRTHHVIVTGDGFLYQDRSYRSLSQIAQLITGAKWSGPRFFGLNGRSACSNDGARDVAA